MTKQTFGTTIQISASAISGATGKLSTVTSVGFPNPSTGTIDVTHHESPGGIEEVLPDLVSMAEFQVKILVTPGDTTDVACNTAAVSRAMYYFKINAVGASAAFTYSGQGVVTGYDLDDAPVRGVYTATLKIKPSGAITRA
jgi:hypothetical protein